MHFNCKQMSENLSSENKNWFETWFNSKYYHILYKDRDDTEAEQFMDNLTQYLNLPEASKIMDLACGKGRHAIYLNKLGYDVTGADLAGNSIEEASKCSNDSLHFIVHDMRYPTKEKYDAVLNLFTSFGYFDHEEDNLKTLLAIKESLTEYGFGVIDFMNVTQVINNLVPEETKEVDGIAFHLKRYVKDGHICKEIDFEDQGNSYHFIEKVRALTLQDFENLMEQAGIYLLDIFGDYKLRKFYKNDSQRLIMIFK